MVSQPVCETQRRPASHTMNETTHKVHADQIEPSQNIPRTHIPNANQISQRDCKTQTRSASQNFSETQEKGTIVSHKGGVENQARRASHGGTETHLASASYLDRLRILTNLYIDLQKVRIATMHRARHIKDPDLDTLIGEVESLENSVKKDLSDVVREHPFYNYWLKNVHGIGEVLSAQLVCYITGQVHTPKCKEEREKYFAKKEKGERKRAPFFECDCPLHEIERFPKVSSLWKYAGYHVVDGKAPKMKKGEKVTWNPKFRALCWNIVDSFVKQRKSFYRERYDEFKEQERTKSPNLTAKHIDLRARRKVAKLFLEHVFKKWYELKGLKPPEPYPIGILGHKDYIEPP